ncbi:ly6/PLAUR domain-containing protein 6B-like, partial [Thrips palmi]|uniref:Ly6/PLAUR domain-containing protein 6B-like n=1 Tax=Thrips palmi TaxID=161013 RepID=A0A6P8YU07_THRPL
AFGAFGAGPAYGAALDELELLAQIADAPVDDGKLTCFTCTNGTDNDQCNKYAVDRPCEPGLTLCRTDHVIERFPVPVAGVGAGAGGAAGAPSRPRSVRITKSCVAASECSRASVGCRGVAGDSTYLRVCTSCCDWSYCNELAPADTLTAVLALSRNTAGVIRPLPALSTVTVFVLLSVISDVF